MTQVAEACGVSRAATYKWSKGIQVPGDRATYTKLIEFLGVTEEEVPWTSPLFFPKKVLFKQ